MFMQRQRQPAVGADGSLYLTTMGGANGWGLKRVDPGNGNVLWNYSPWPSNGMSPPSVAPDGSVYFSRSLAYLESVAPTGQSRWTFSDGGIVDQPAVSPDGSIVVAGNRPNFGEPGSARGWNASTGALVWQVDLPNEDGGYQIVYTQPRFSADSGTAYFGTAILAGGDHYSYLYAVDTGVAAAQCIVPEVVGMPFDKARELIREAGCTVGRITWFRSEKPGRVYAQNPAAGTRVPLGSAVDLTVGRR
jgi:outer membrane protein assembly factor BamB